MIFDQAVCMNRRIGALLTLALAAAASCGIVSEPVVCTDEARPAIAVEVRDSVSNALVGEGARVIAADGSFADTAFAISDVPVVGLAHERSGNYVVTVRQAGYLDWSRTGIRVTEGPCHVHTVTVVALLQSQ